MLIVAGCIYLYNCSIVPLIISRKFEFSLQSVNWSQINQPKWYGTTSSDAISNQRKHTKHRSTVKKSSTSSKSFITDLVLSLDHGKSLETAYIIMFLPACIWLIKTHFLLWLVPRLAQFSLTQTFFTNSCCINQIKRKTNKTHYMRGPNNRKDRDLLMPTRDFALEKESAYWFPKVGKMISVCFG